MNQVNQLNCGVNIPDLQLQGIALKHIYLLLLLLLFQASESCAVKN
mgnify:CR=1 FL=1